MADQAGRHRRVLVIDDDDAAREGIVEYLVSAGFEVQSRCDGRQALECLKANFLPDVILLDLSMPVMSGPEFHAAVQADARWRAIPIVIVTAHAHDAAPLTVDAVLTKPFSPDRLLSVIAATTGEPRGSGRVLVVEDEVDIRSAVVEMLELSGFDVVAAGHGGEALAHLRAGLQPDIIVTDLLMPEMNGWDLLQQLRQEPAWAEIPVVVVSAAPPETATRIPVGAVLAKPIRPPALIKAVESACQAHPSRRRLRGAG